MRLRVTVRGATPVEGVTAIAQNSDPFTYFSTKPVYVNEDIAIDDGTLSMAVLKRAAMRDMPTLLAASSREEARVRHRQIVGFEDLTAATIESISEDRSGAPAPSTYRSTATTSASGPRSSSESSPAR